MPQQHPQMQVNGQQVPIANGQVQGQQQGRPMQPINRNGHMAVPNTNGQGIPQAQMQRVAPHPNMQQMQHANNQARNPQFSAQQFQLANGNMGSPGPGMTNQQQLQNNQALLAAAFTAQQQQNGVNGGPMQAMNGVGPQKVASPSMPPPPTPQGVPQQLSSGHVPAINAIKTQLRAANPNMSQEQLDLQAMQQLKTQHQSMTQARQNAMNAAAGLQSQPNAGMQQPPQQQQAYNQNGYQGNRQIANGAMAAGMYVNGDGNAQQQPNLAPTNNQASPPQHNQQAYAQKMMRMQQMQMQMQQSPNQNHANLNNGSPAVSHASPNMTPASPSMQFNNMNQMGGMNGQMAPAAGMNGQQRPNSRSNTPQMQRLGSSGNGPVQGMNVNGSNGMQSPGAQLQGSPRNMQASMAR
jgi:chromatin modification-related protein VID21